MPVALQRVLSFVANKNLIVGGGVPDAPDGVCVITPGGVKTPPYEQRQTIVKIQTANHAHLRGVEDAAPYTLANPYPFAEDSAAGSRQSVLC